MISHIVTHRCQSYIVYAKKSIVFSHTYRDGDVSLQRDEGGVLEVGVIVGGVRVEACGIFSMYSFFGIVLAIVFGNYLAIRVFVIGTRPFKFK